RDFDLQFHTGKAKWRHSERTLQFQLTRIETNPLFRNITGLPVDHRRIRALPHVFVRRPWRKGGLKKKRKLSFRFHIPRKNGAEFLLTRHCLIENFAVRFEEHPQPRLSRGY